MREERRETELYVDRAVYLVDEETRTYRYLRRNPGWKAQGPAENERNKRHLDGYTRIFPDGRRKVFTFRPPYTGSAGRQAGRPSAGPGS